MTSGCGHIEISFHCVCPVLAAGVCFQYDIETFRKAITSPARDCGYQTTAEQKWIVDTKPKCSR